MYLDTCFTQLVLHRDAFVASVGEPLPWPPMRSGASLEPSTAARGTSSGSLSTLWMSAISPQRWEKSAKVEQPTTLCFTVWKSIVKPCKTQPTQLGRPTPKLPSCQSTKKFQAIAISRFPLIFAGHFRSEPKPRCFPLVILPCSHSPTSWV